MTILRSPANGSRVCHVVYARYPADPRVRREVETLARRGFVVDVLCLHEDGRPSAEDAGAVHVYRLPLTAIRGSRARYVYQYALFLLLVAVRLTISSTWRRYTVIHLHSLPDFLVLAAIPARLIGCRVILDLHESMPHLYLARFGDRAGSLIHRLTSVAQRISCMMANEVVTVNPVLEGLLEENGVPSRRITLIENSPDWETSTVQKSSLGDQPSASPEIVIAGGLNDERDLILVLRAIGEVSQTRQVRLSLVGTGDASYVRQLRQAVHQLGVEGVVNVRNEVSQADVQSLVSRTIIGIVSYRRNPLTEIATPNKAYEYAALGKAMVVADLLALRRLLGDSVLYYEPGNFASLATSVARLLDDQGLRYRLGQQALGVSNEHRWELMSERLGALYSRLSGSGRRPSEGV